MANGVMLVQAKKIYILIIKVNKLLSFFHSGVLLKEIGNIPVFSMVLSSERNICESCGNTCLQLVLPQHFSFSQTFTCVSITQ